MGRYDEPHFDVDNETVVSVWAAIVSWDEIPEDYWMCDFEGGDGDPWNCFSADFGFGYYDDSFVEGCFDEDSRANVPIGDLIAPLSYSSSFASAVVRRAKALGLEDTSYVFLMYDFKYDPRVTGRDESTYLRFVGTFPYKDEEA